MPDLESQPLSRRSMLKGTAGAGAAGLAIGALATVAPAAAATTRSPNAAHGDATQAAQAGEESNEAIVVHVRDAASGDIDVFRGTTQIQRARSRPGRTASSAPAGDPAAPTDRPRTSADPDPKDLERQLMSSHREAPEISKDPVADSTDLYAFVSPDQPDTVTIIANYIPLQRRGGRPELLRVRRRRPLRDQHRH